MFSTLTLYVNIISVQIVLFDSKMNSLNYIGLRVWKGFSVEKLVDVVWTSTAELVKGIVKNNI